MEEMEFYFHNSLKKFGKFGAAVEITRPWMSVSMALIATAFYTFLYDFDLLIFFYFLVHFSLLFGFGTSLNDIDDLELDKINMPFRPLQEEKLSVADVKKISYLLFVLSVISTWILSMQYTYHVIIFSTIFIIFALFYSLKSFNFSRRLFLAPITLVIVYMLVPAMIAVTLYGLAPINNFNILTSLTFTAFFFGGIILLKDFKDTKGDQQFGKKTAAWVYGTKNTLKMIITSTLIFFPLTIISFSFFIDNKLNYLIMSAVLFILLIYYLVKAIKNTKGIFTIGRLIIMTFFILTILMSI